MEELLKVSKPGAVHIFSHYLYFSARKPAEAAAAELRSLGFSTEDPSCPDGVDWLVLVRQELVPSEETVARVRHQMEDIARRCGGEYDGWEAEVQY
jgi:hypothetical protein